MNIVKKLDSIKVDFDDVEKSQKYVNRKEHEKFKNLIMKDEKICDTNFPSEIYDYNVYLFYFSNFGSQSDIGAKFAGFIYTGFDNQIQTK